MSISESLYFIYDNINFYEEYGIMNVHIDSGMYQETFLSGREILEQRTRRNPKPYLFQVKELPREIQMSFAFSESFDEDKLRSVARALTKDSYRQLIFSENPDKIFYAICVDEPQLIHNGLKLGYVTLKFRCNSPYAYSPVYIDDLIDLSSNPSTGTPIIFSNLGDIPCQPQISLLKINDGDISIINNSDSGKEFKLSSLLDSEGVPIALSSLKNNEDLFIDNENEEITSSIPDTYRINNLTGDFISLPRGINNLIIKGTCKIQFRYQFKTR